MPTPRRWINNQTPGKSPAETDSQDQTVELVLIADTALYSVLCASSLLDVVWAYWVLTHCWLGMVCNGRPVLARPSPGREEEEQIRWKGDCTG